MVFALVVFCVLTNPVEAQEGEGTWSGRWHTFWRDGQALMRLSQNGNRVSGTYRPGDGRIEGVSRDGILEGEWSQDGGSGRFTFVLAPDGKSFAGRYATGTYWNGARVKSDEFRPTPFYAADTPRNALRTIIVAANEAVDGNSSAALIFEPLLAFDGEDATAEERQDRFIDYYRLLSMATFNLESVPGSAEGDVVGLDVGPAGSDFRFSVTLERGENNRWRLVVPTSDVIEATSSALLQDVGAESFAAYQEARRDSPRGVMRAFTEAVNSWNAGGEARALEVMDLSGIPPALRSINAPLAADYLRQIIDRVGYTIWQEIPDYPNRIRPYVHYEHALGKVEIARVPGDEEPLWRFSADSIAAAPQIFEAIENLPLGPGMSVSEPFSEYFALRDLVADVSPRLLERKVLLAHWQWIAIALSVIVAALVAFLVGRLLRRGWRVVPEVKGDAGEKAPPRLGAIVWALRILIVGAVLYTAFGAIGLRADVLSVLATSAALITLLGAVVLVFTLVGAAGRAFHSQAERKPGAFDVIVTSLLTAVLKIAVIIMGAIIGADIVGIPYEGVVAGLGVGGLALAIAARDTVSNFFGAAVLLAERPFKRGDYIELDGRSAIVEEVGLRSSRMRLFDDAQMIIPNAKVADNTVINYGRRRKRQVLLTLSLKYATPRERIDAFVSRLKDLLRTFPRADAEYYVGLSRFAEVRRGNRPVVLPLGRKLRGPGGSAPPSRRRYCCARRGSRRRLRAARPRSDHHANGGGCANLAADPDPRRAITGATPGSPPTSGNANPVPAVATHSRRPLRAADHSRRR